MFHRYVEIPKLFYSEETEAPFAHCIDCDCALLPGEQDYTVQKVFVRDEAVFEYAMCRPCAEKLRTQLSQETQTAYSEFLFASADLSLRLPLVLEPEDRTYEDWVENCLVCAKPRSDCYRFSLCGVFNGSSLVLGEFPAVICEDCEKQLSELTSKETQDRWNQFVEENFDGPPGVELDSPYTQPMLL